MCMDMYIDMCVDMRTELCIDMCEEKCIDMCIDIHVHMCVDRCVDMCTEVCIGMCRPSNTTLFGKLFAEAVILSIHTSTPARNRDGVCNAKYRTDAQPM